MKKLIQSGDPLLVVGSRSFYERALPDGLKSQFSIFYFDHRGFDENPGAKDSCYSNLQEIVEELDQFCLKNDLDHFFLLGHSGHAYMVLEFANFFPQKARGIILCGCSPDLSQATHLAASSYFDELANEERKEIFRQDMNSLKTKIELQPELRFVHFVLCQRAKNWFDPNYDASWLWEGVPTHLPTLDYVWGKLFAGYQIKSGQSQISIPVLLIQGKFDFVAGPASQWNPYLSHFQQVEVHIFDRSGHYPMVEEPSKFELLIKDWATRLIQSSKSVTEFKPRICMRIRSSLSR